MKEINKVYPINDKNVLLIGKNNITGEEVRVVGYRNKKLSKFFHDYTGGTVDFTHYMELTDENTVTPETESQQDLQDLLLENQIFKKLGFLKTTRLLFWFLFNKKKTLLFIDALKKDYMVMSAYEFTKRQ